MNPCEFCNEFSGGHQNGYSRRYGQSRRTVLDSDAFQVVPTLGQISEGHVLIVPTKHYCSLADHPSASDELDFLFRRVRKAIRKLYGVCIFFEHGIRGSGSGGCGIDHAHMHAVPVAGDGVLAVLARDFGGWQIQRLADINEKVDPSSSYLFYEASSAKRYVFPVQDLPSQYMRKLVAESIGKRDWDWRKAGYEPALISTIQRLTPLLSTADIATGV